MSGEPTPDKTPSIEAALTVLDFTVHFLSQLIRPEDYCLVKSQVAAAHEAYREVTGEPDWSQLIQERITDREKRTQA